MKLHLSGPLVLTVWFCLFVMESAAAPLIERPGMPDFDRRAGGAAVTAAGARQAPAAELRAQVAGAKIDFDEVVGSPKWIRCPEGYLSGAGGEGKGISAAVAAGFATDDPHRTVKAFVQEHQALFGHGPEVLAAPRVYREYVTPHNGMKTTLWQQELDGIEVYEGVFAAHTTKNGELIGISSQFMADPSAAANAGATTSATRSQPVITAQQAVVNAAGSLDEPVDLETVEPLESGPTGQDQRQQFTAGPFNQAIETRLVWLPMTPSLMRLCWEVTLTSRARGETYRMLVDAQTGEVQVRRCLTVYLSDATYRVYTSDSPSPFSPGWSTPSSVQPSLTSRVLVTSSALDTNASPNGWIDDGVNETRGNNVDAHTDRDANDVPDLPRPQGSPFRVFDFSMDLGQAPSTYTNAAVVQLFYWCNFMHDKLYELGFTEAAGNYQNTNFGRGGLGNDAVQADAQDGSGYNNANFTPTSDGTPPRIQMYLFNGPTPYRDGDFDAEVVLHEYTHGLSERLVGSGVGISALQTGGMGEGWSDWYAMSVLSESGDDLNGCYASGGYVTYMLSGMTQNYYFGIRRYPYSTDLTKNPLTFKDIDPSQASSHTGIPRSSIIGTTANEVHNMGEVWCVTLWEARANLINKYGWAVGNQLIMQLVTDGMKLSPANPNFLQARDAILLADQVDTGGANRNELWAAFAKRGMGFTATSPSSSTTTGLHEAFDIPNDLLITPNTGFSGSGPVGGPFTPNSMTFTLTNVGSNSLNWTLVNTSPWLNVFPAGGTLTPGGLGVSVTASLDASVGSLPMGIYSATVWFTNLNSLVVQNRQFTLRVGQPDYYTELFDASDNDLDYQSWTFTPDDSVNFYAVCRDAATNFPTDPTGGTVVTMGDDTYAQVTLSGTNTVAIYGRRTNIFYIGSNGYLTLNSGDSSLSESFAAHFNLPRVSALFDDLYPSTGQVTWKQMSNRVAVTFLNVREYGYSNTNSFQIEMFDDGRIRLTYLRIDVTDGLAGLSAGTGVPTGFTESDFSSYGSCSLPLFVVVPPSATEGDGVLAGAGQVRLLAAPTTNLTVTLSSSDATEVTVPANVTILAGQTNAVFDLTIVDDGVLDGTQTAAITASASGYNAGSANIAVFDNETATLQVALPATATEGQGTITGAVQVVGGIPAANITVNLSSSDTTEIQVPVSVIIPSGQNSTVFTATVVNDNQIDGPQTATVTAHVQNWIDGSVIITVLDNENTNLTVTLPAQAREGDGILTNAGAVSISGTLPTNLVVTLVSDDTTELVVPATVTILAGQTTSSFNLTVVDDPDVDGAQIVHVTASAGGFADGSRAMTIYDNESPPVPSNPSPAHLATNVIQTTGLSWQSGAVSGEVISNDVYFGTNPTPGPGELQGTTTNTSWTLPLLAPQTTYYWQIVARKTGTTAGPVWQFTTRGVDHFAWDPVASPQFVNQPFGATITAKDAFNTTVSNFTGTVNLLATGSSGGPQTGSVVPYFSDNNPFAVGPEAPIAQAGFTPLLVTNISALNLNSYGILFINEVNNSSLSSLLLGSLTNIQGWVENGGFLIVHDRSAGNISPNPFLLGTTGISTVRLETSDLDVVPPGMNLVVAGPFGTINNTNLDGGTSSAHGYVAQNQLPPSASSILSIGGNTNQVVAFSYHVGRGQIYYSTIPLDYYLAGGPGEGNVIAEPLQHIYTPNVLTYGSSLSSGALVPITPTNSGNFVNGVWSGNITVLQPATNIVLRADDGSGHTGTSTNFDVVLQNDISISIADSPDPVSAGASLTYTLTVANTGPAAATGVMVTNLLPSSATFMSATASQGTCTQAAGVVTCDLGTISGGTNATITIVVVPTTAGTIITNIATVSRMEADPFLGNNTAMATTTVTTPAISIADASVAEGNVGTTSLVFAVTLAAPSAQTITVNYATTNGSATAGSDYLATNGILTFPPGTTNQSLTVIVMGDTTIESNETLYVNLSSPVNGTLGRSQGMGTIVNDDGLPGQVDHFDLSSVASPQFMNVPFPLTVIAKDAFNSIVSNFIGTASLRAGGGSGQGEIFRANFESGLQGFTVSNAFGLGNGLWHLSPGRGAQAGHSPSNSIYYGTGEGPNGGGTYNNGLANEGIITSPTIDLSAAAAPLTLSFNCLIQSEPGTAWDHATVEISTNNGVSYAVICGNNQGGVLFGTDSGGLWIVVTNNISSYAGKQIQLRLHFNTIDSGANNYEGWYVDDIVIFSGNTPAPISISPTNSGAFVNGAWVGNITVLQPATNVVLQADDGNGHTGSSNPFDVVVQNDISISITDSPDPVSVGANLTYTLTVANTGPSAATGVMVTNLLPASAPFMSATSSQGTCTQAGGVVTCDLGTISGGTNATITIVVVPTTAGTIITNLATVSRMEIDPYLGNNTAMATTTVATPAISIADASVAEGNAGTTSLVFAVTLAAPSAQTITVNYATTNGSATAGSDYFATNGILTFPSGTTNQSLTVTVMGDTTIESNETLYVNLSSPVNGTLGRSQGVGTIVNDDGLPGLVDHFAWSTISAPQYVSHPFGATITAKDAFNTTVSNFTGTVGLSGLTGTTTNRIMLTDLGYDTTSSGTYTRGIRFQPTNTITVTHVRHFWGTKVSIWTDSGTLLVSKNVVSSGGTWQETALDVPVVLTAGTVYRVAGYAAGGTYYYRSSGGMPFNFPDGVILNGAYSNNGDVFPDGTSTIRYLVDLRYTVSSGGPVAITPTNSDNFTNGVWMGNLTVLQPATNVVLRADDGNGHIGSSNPFDVVILQDLLLVSPSDGLVSQGYEGGPFNPSNKVYTLSNGGTNALNWSASCPQAWGPVLTNTSPNAVRVIVINSPQNCRFFRAVASTPGVQPVLSAPSYAAGQFQFTLSGQTNASYIIEALTDLQAQAGWVTVDPSGGSLVPGASTNVTVSINANAQSLSDGVYTATVAFRNLTSGATQGRPVSLTVLTLAPNIITQPTNQAVVVGGTANFNVVASGGTPLSYQWYFNGTNVVGATNTTLTLTNVQPAQAGSYTVLVTNVHGSILSSNAVLTVLGGVGVLTTTFAGGNGFAGNMFDIMPKANLGITALDVNVSSTETGQVATVTVFYRNGTSFGHEGSSAGWILLGTRTVTAAGQGAPTHVDLSGNGVEFLQGQTYGLYVYVDYDSGAHMYYTDGTNTYENAVIRLITNCGKGTPPFTGSTFSPRIWNGTIYYTAGPVSDSAPAITSQPANQTVPVGSAATFSVTASGTAPLSYFWMRNGTPIAGANSSSYTTNNVQLSDSGAWFSCLVSNAFGTTLSSNAVLTVNPPASCAPAPSGLVDWWPAEGNANDVVGTNNGTLVNGAGFATGEVGQAFSFNGTSYVSIPNSSSLCSFTTSITIETWIKLNQLTADSNWEGIVTKGNSSWRLMATAGAKTVYFAATGVSNWDVYGSRNVRDGQWHHVAAVYDGTNMFLYVDGTLDVSHSATGTISQNSYPVCIGENAEAPGLLFNGMIDEASIYNRALTASEIQAIYAAGSGGKCPLSAPGIVSQPTNQTVNVGGTASFSVAASGTPPLSYQWWFNGTNINGATNTTLVLTNVQLSQAGNYTVLVTNSYGSILSSNAVLTVTLDHFAWNPIPSPRFVNTPFSVIIRAQDLTNGIFTNFTGTAILGTTNGVAVTPPVSGNFMQGVWTGSVVISQTATNLVLQADDGLGHFGLANPINVLSLPTLGMLHSGNIALYMWPVGYSGFVLETSGNLSPATWVVVPYSPIQIGDQYLLPLDMTGTNGFYRLWFPGP